MSESGSREVREVSGGGRCVRLVSVGRGGEGGGEKRYLWIGEDIVVESSNLACYCRDVVILCCCTCLEERVNRYRSLGESCQTESPSQRSVAVGVRSIGSCSSISVTYRERYATVFSHRRQQKPPPSRVISFRVRNKGNEPDLVGTVIMNSTSEECFVVTLGKGANKGTRRKMRGR